MTVAEFERLTGIPLFTEPNCQTEFPAGFGREEMERSAEVDDVRDAKVLCDEVLWSARDTNDDSNDARFVALVRRDAWYYRIEGSHDNTGWDCHADASVAGPFSKEQAFGDLVISRAQIAWDPDGWDAARVKAMAG